jgi:hypothetical protein
MGYFPFGRWFFGRRPEDMGETISPFSTKFVERGSFLSFG